MKRFKIPLITAKTTLLLILCLVISSPALSDIPKIINYQGYYLHPEAYGQPKEKGIGWVEDPVMIKQTEG